MLCALLELLVAILVIAKCLCQVVTSHTLLPHFRQIARCRTSTNAPRGVNTPTRGAMLVSFCSNTSLSFGMQPDAQSAVCSPTSCLGTCHCTISACDQAWVAFVVTSGAFLAGFQPVKNKSGRVQQALTSRGIPRSVQSNNSLHWGGPHPTLPRPGSPTADPCASHTTSCSNDQEEEGTQHWAPGSRTAVRARSQHTVQGTHDHTHGCAWFAITSACTCSHVFATTNRRCATFTTQTWEPRTLVPATP